jgi:hypothetical protein
MSAFIPDKHTKLSGRMPQKNSPGLREDIHDLTDRPPHPFRKRLQEFPKNPTLPVAVTNAPHTEVEAMEFL